MVIGALAQRTGSKAETIRYYERIGLLPAPARSAGGYRLYGDEHLKRLTFIRQARALGFSLAEVRRLLALAASRTRSCDAVRRVAEGHLADVRAKIAVLRTMERVLTDTVARCAAGADTACPLIDALSRGADGSTDSNAVSRRGSGPT
jgi:MerR family mercuric resistance operon transcriptional regulator